MKSEKGRLHLHLLVLVLLLRLRLRKKRVVVSLRLPHGLAFVHRPEA